MRILLDECLPRELADELTGHVVRTVGRMGWAGKKNGELLRLAGPEFDVLITADHSLPKQQNLRGRNIRVVTLIAHNNKMESLRPLLPQLRRALRKIKPGQVIRVSA